MPMWYHEESWTRSNTEKVWGKKWRKLESLLQLCSPESRKTVSQDGRYRALDRKHQSFFDCLRLQISAVFSQRPICFDKDLSPSPRERWEEAEREKYRQRKNGGEEGGLSLIWDLSQQMLNDSPSPVSISFSLPQLLFSDIFSFV